MDVRNIKKKKTIIEWIEHPGQIKIENDFYEKNIRPKVEEILKNYEH